jgi:hypothetical protein
MTNLNFLNLFLKLLYLISLINLKLKIYTLLKILNLKIILKTSFSKSLIILA